MDADAKKILRESLKNMNPDDAKAAALWFIVFITVGMFLWYLGASWLTLHAVNALFGEVVAVEFSQMLAVAWFIFLIRHLVSKAKES